MGLDNIVVVHSKSNTLAGDILSEAGFKKGDPLPGDLSNIVIMASQNTLNSGKLEGLTGEDEGGKGAFIAAVNPDKLFDHYRLNGESHEHQLDIE